MRQGLIKEMCWRRSSVCLLNSSIALSHPSSSCTRVASEAPKDTVAGDSGLSPYSLESRATSAGILQAWPVSRSSPIRVLIPTGTPDPSSDLTPTDN